MTIPNYTLVPLCPHCESDQLHADGCYFCQESFHADQRTWEPYGRPAAVMQDCVKMLEHQAFEAQQMRDWDLIPGLQSAIDSLNQIIERSIRKGNEHE